ncbi:hypothetical protein KCP70_07320 [Salmonella enterica subsp. enterica]|nr:hypothetical protein KCP70_07320 [Salmonella enterica subsp. enterica]
MACAAACSVSIVRVELLRIARKSWRRVRGAPVGRTRHPKPPIRSLPDDDAASYRPTVQIG